MTKSKEELALEAFRKVPWQFVNNMSFESVYTNGFRTGYDSRNDEVSTLQNFWEQATQANRLYAAEIGRLRAALEKAKEGLGFYTKCDSYCATDECVCNTSSARATLATIEEMLK